VLTTKASYPSIGDDLARSQTTATADPTISRETTHYPAGIGKVTSIDDFVNNYQLFFYAVEAFCLRDATYANGRITTIEGASSDSKRHANRMSDPRYEALATAFGSGPRAARVVAVTAATNIFLQRQAEHAPGKPDRGVQRALYFKRNADGAQRARICSPTQFF
jgi:hypothetical protein